MLGLSCGQVLVEVVHKDMCGSVVHLPEAHEQGVCPRLLESPLQSEDTVSGDVAQSGLACRHDDEVHPPEVQL